MADDERNQRTGRGTRWAILAGTLMVVLAMAAVGAAQGPPDRAQQHQERGQQEAAQWQALSGEQRQMAMQRAEEARLFALLTAQDGQAMGRYVEFSYDDAAGQIADYVYKDGTARADFLAGVQVEPFTKAQDARTAGAVLLMFGEDALLRVHNNPTGQIHAVTGAEGGSVTFRLAEGVTIRAEMDREVIVASGAIHGHILLAGNGTYVVEDGNITVTTEESGSVLFMVHPATASARITELHDRLAAIKAGRMGGELSVVAVGDPPVGEASEYGVSMRAERAAPGQVQVRVSSDASQGRVVTIHIDRELLGTALAADVLVQVDGQAGERVGSAREVLMSAPGSQARYHVEDVAGAWAVHVAVPHFSDRTITVSTSEETTTPSLGAVALLATLGAAAVAVAVARRDRRR